MDSKLLKYGLASSLMVQRLATAISMQDADDCHSQTCRPVEEYCSQFEQTCLPCNRACDPKDLKYEPAVCSRECNDFIKLQPIKKEIHYIQMQQNVVLFLLILLLIITALHFTCKLIKWLKHKRFIVQLMKKLKLKKAAAQPTTFSNGKDLGGTTIQNTCAINDMERASQIYSLAGAEGSVMTVTTPISTRHPAENTTPTNEYSYDNQALAVTPVSEKPNGGPMFS